MKTTIEVTSKTRLRLNKKKYDLNCKTLDETINKLIDLSENEK